MALYFASWNEDLILITGNRQALTILFIYFPTKCLSDFGLWCLKGQRRLPKYAVIFESDLKKLKCQYKHKRKTKRQDFYL